MPQAQWEKYVQAKAEAGPGRNMRPLLPPNAGALLGASARTELPCVPCGLNISILWIVIVVGEVHFYEAKGISSANHGLALFLAKHPNGHE